jgi:[glutamine synthetase] adenylyltransferase / [glutamine synthetase]-adenylyl-L-tyrosine phosphorylase
MANITLNTIDRNCAAPYLRADVERCFTQWSQLAASQEDSSLKRWMEAAQADNETGGLLQALFGNSPYLARLALLYPEILRDMAAQGADAVYAHIISALDSGERPTQEALMRDLRVAKNKTALLTASADISSHWTLAQVTRALSDFAERALKLAVDTLLAAACQRGEIVLPHPDAPSQGSGIVVLGMGKLGGHELNYSSDIDLMVFFERGRLNYKGRHNEQHFMNRLAHDIVHIMQERTADGYVFRTDLRLRPDPASTPPAINTEAAYNYYESVGQNWERAAMIKARPVAGDIAAGERFLAGLTPFMWRRSLDFASIQDIHSIKRQMDSYQNKAIELKGHNIKLGLGGIREIEFYVQVHQLIWGGREPGLRLRGTCETLAALTEKGQIDSDKRNTMRSAYEFLRTLEHRLQMIADEQTHSLPETDEGLAHIACFMGYDSVKDFSRALLAHLKAVHAIYASSFQSSEKLGGAGHLVFTGASHDPETLETLRSMGYANPEIVSEIVMGWHHGSKRATRTKRARELLTELMPLLLKRLSETANADAAFLKFNEFLTNLPAGVQLFSLFSNNPELLGLIADIMGSAPTLAERLSKSPDLLDAVLYADFYGPLPSSGTLAQQLAQTLSVAQDFEERMDALRRFRNEKQFQVGVQLLKRMITAREAGHFLSDLADVLLGAAYEAVYEEFAKSHGRIPGGDFAIIGLGKLGSREMTFGSDIDLVFVYDAPDSEILSDGEKGFTAGVYYNRLAHRFLNALTTMGRDGRLYEVDTRLRPSGKQGMLATSLLGLEHYFNELAWTFEYMAFTKARVVSGGMMLRQALDKFVTAQLRKPRDVEKLRSDVADMRVRIDKEFGTTNPWDIKYVRGGLIDIDFMTQFLLLSHAPQAHDARPGSAADTLAWLKDSRRIDAPLADSLLAADRFLGHVFNMVRLCCDRAFNEATAPPGLQKLLYESAQEKDFKSLKARLLEVEAAVLDHYIQLLEQPNGGTHDRNG